MLALVETLSLSIFRAQVLEHLCDSDKYVEGTHDGDIVRENEGLISGYSHSELMATCLVRGVQGA